VARPRASNVSIVYCDIIWHCARLRSPKYHDNCTGTMKRSRYYSWSTGVARNFCLRGLKHTMKFSLNMKPGGATTSELSDRIRENLGHSGHGWDPDLWTLVPAVPLGWPSSPWLTDPEDDKNCVKLPQNVTTMTFWPCDSYIMNVIKCRVINEYYCIKKLCILYKVTCHN